MPRKRTRSDADAGRTGGSAGRREHQTESGAYPETEADAPDELLRTGYRGRGVGGTQEDQPELFFTGEELKETRGGGAPDTEDR